MSIALNQVFTCIAQNKNFVLQGGAGSGKTESLKQVLEHISGVYPEKKVACITHTNLAVEEIKSRIESDYTICTIHSFLNSLIKNYKKNIHEVIVELFKLQTIDNSEHKEYKKAYEKYSSSLFIIKGESSSKVIGKREYDRNSIELNDKLNEKIKLLNDEIEQIIKAQDYNKIRYNETRFNSFDDLTYGHDGLLQVSSLLFTKYPLLSKIIQDKFDFIFIDEYQDTNRAIIELFIDKVAREKITLIGLFGDSMQGIYEDGIGSVKDYISSNKLIEVMKEDNFRCSEQVVNFINQLRDDGLHQMVVLKEEETNEERQGFVKLYYSIYNGERTNGGTPRNKEEYLNHVNSLTTIVEKKHPDFKKLMLTNKAIASEVGFGNLYSVFDERYSEVINEIERVLDKLQLLDLAELTNSYTQKDYNFVITELKKAGFKISTVNDKETIRDILDSISSSDKGAIEVLNLAFEKNLIKPSDSYKSYMNRKDEFMREIKTDETFQKFKTSFEQGNSTYKKMTDVGVEFSEQEFDELKREYNKERFYIELFSDKIKFIEIMNLFLYVEEETQYMTMHKTKGSGIENVMVILEEFFWTQYKFNTIFDSSATDDKRKLSSQKLFYVACSRAIKNLLCVRVISSEEEEDLISFFDECEKIVI